MLKNKFTYLNCNLGTAKGTSLLELMKTFERVYNVKFPFRYCSRRDGDVAYSVADNKLKKVF